MATEDRTLLDESTATAGVDTDPAALAEPSGAATESSSSASRRRRSLQAVGELLQDLVIAAFVCIFLVAYVVQAFKVQGTSMAR